MTLIIDNTTGEIYYCKDGRTLSIVLERVKKHNFEIKETKDEIN